jgi:hypothetical protein
LASRRRQPEEARAELEVSHEYLPEEFFDGKVEGWAVLESPVGGLQKRATIVAEGKRDAGVKPFASSRLIDLMTITPIL